MKRSLYICYFGLRQPLVRTQVLPYLQELAKGGIDVSLLTFEPELSSEWTPEAIEAERIKLAERADRIRNQTAAEFLVDFARQRRDVILSVVTLAARLHERCRSALAHQQ